MNDLYSISLTSLRQKKAASSYISDAAAIKEFYTAVCLVDGKELQHRIHKAMDSIITSWTRRHDDTIEALNQLEHSYVTLQRESQAQATLYHKSVRETQFYKSKYHSLLSNNMNSSHYVNRHQNSTPPSSASLQFDRNSYLSIDSCGRSTVASNLVNTSSITEYSRYSESSRKSCSSSDDSYYHLSTISSSSFSPSPGLPIQEPTSRPPPLSKIDTGNSLSNTRTPNGEMDNEKDSLVQGNQDENDSFDIMSVFEYSYPNDFPSAKPPPTCDLPLPPPSSPPPSSAPSSFPSASPLTSSAPSSSPPPSSLTSANIDPPEVPKKDGAIKNLHESSFQMPTGAAPLTEELSFACGEGFWNTIARGKPSNKNEVDILVKNYLKRGGGPNVANNAGTIKAVKEGYGLIHALIVIRNTSALRSVIEAGANPHALPLIARADDQISPLVLAARLGYMNGVRLLVERARVNILSSKGPRQENALLVAVEADALDVVRYLLRLSRQLLDQADVHGATPLHYACMAGKTRMISLLVHEFGQNPEVADYRGETPLHYAIRNRRAKVVAKLVGEFGVYPNAYVAKEIPTPLDMAKSGGLHNIAVYLKKMGAKTVKEMEKASGGKSEVTGLTSGMAAMSIASLTNSSDCSTLSERTGYSSESIGSSSSRNFVLSTASLMKNKLDELMM